MLWRTTLMLTALLVVGCIDTPRESPIKRTTSLYKRMGGEPKMEQIADAFMDEMLLSEEIGRVRKERLVGADRAATRRRVITELTRITKGTPPQEGEDSSEAMLAVNIKSPESVAIVGALLRALKACQVPQRDEEDLMKALAPPPA